MGENKRLKEEIESMSEDKAKQQLNNLEKLIELNKYSIDSKRRELNEIKKDEIVRRYITLESMIQSLEEDEEKTKNKIRLLRQKICNHKIVYLLNMEQKMLMYRPDLICLNCGKSIHELDKNQIVINEDYLDKNEHSYNGDIAEYNNLSLLYSDYKNAELSEEEIITLLHDELHKKNKGKKHTYNVLRLKKDDE